MSNKEEFEKILKITGDVEYVEDKRFNEEVVKKFMFWRNLTYITIIPCTFYLIQDGRIIPENYFAQLLTTMILLVVLVCYLNKRSILTRELNGCLYRECWPDIAYARYMGLIPKMVKRQMLWNVVQYNLGYIFFRMGRMDKAVACLELMQESSGTVNGMLRAEHLKQEIALYYEDYETVIACAKEVAELFVKAKKSVWNRKIHNDTQLAAACAVFFQNKDYRQIYSVLQAPQQRHVDEVKRIYYLYLAAKGLNDTENAETYMKYVKENAGTTWYGKAVEEGFVKEERPVGYPGFVADPELMQHPKKVDQDRLKWLLLGIIITVLIFLIPRLF